LRQKSDVSAVPFGSRWVKKYCFYLLYIQKREKNSTGRLNQLHFDQSLIIRYLFILPGVSFTFNQKEFFIFFSFFFHVVRKLLGGFLEMKSLLFVSFRGRYFYFGWSVEFFI
jgi:hypothetical protein